MTQDEYIQLARLLEKYKESLGEEHVVVREVVEQVLNWVREDA